MKKPRSHVFTKCLHRIKRHFIWGDRRDAALSKERVKARQRGKFLLNHRPAKWERGLFASSLCCICLGALTREVCTALYCIGTKILWHLKSEVVSRYKSLAIISCYVMMATKRVCLAEELILLSSTKTTFDRNVWDIRHELCLDNVGQ